MKNYNLLILRKPTIPQEAVSLGVLTEESPLEELLPLKRNFDMLPPLPCPQPQIPVGGWLAHFAQNGTKSLMTNGPSLLWKEDTRSHSRKYLLFQKTHCLPTNQTAKI